MAGQGAARLGKARHGLARLGSAGRGRARLYFRSGPGGAGFRNLLLPAGARYPAAPFPRCGTV